MDAVTQLTPLVLPEPQYIHYVSLIVWKLFFCCFRNRETERHHQHNLLDRIFNIFVYFFFKLKLFFISRIQFSIEIVTFTFPLLRYNRANFKWRILSASMPTNWLYSVVFESLASENYQYVLFKATGHRQKPY